MVVQLSAVRRLVVSLRTPTNKLPVFRWGSFLTPTYRATNTLGRSTDAVVFVTRASELNGLHPSQIADRLTIANSNSFNIVQFPASSVNSIKIPSYSDKPGFIPGGFTQGGASEFLIPNGLFPQGSVVSTVSNRTNGFVAGYNLFQQINDYFGSGSANGGFVLYPNKSNTNMMSSVYSK